MPVRLTTNVDVKNITREAKQLQSRKKSRLSVYLTTTASRQSVTLSKCATLFNETDVQNILQTQQERKKKALDRGTKLKLVWKRTYTPAKTPHEALTDIITQRNICTPKKLRFTSMPHQTSQRKKSKESIGRKDSLKYQTSVTESVCGNSSNFCEEVDYYERRSINRFSYKNAFTETQAQLYKDNDLSKKDLLLGSITDDSTASMRNFEGRISRTIFSTKRAHGNQVQNMYSYRMEKKKNAKNKKLLYNMEKQHLSDRSLESMKAIQLEREKDVPEMKTKVDVDTMLRAYLSEQFLDLNLEGEEAASLRLLYKSAILNQPVIHNLIMQHPDMLPSRIFRDLVNFKKGFEVNPIYSPTVVKAEEGPWREFFFSSLCLPTGNILIELEHDVPQYASFYKKLLEARSNDIHIDRSWLLERKFHTLREKLIHTAVGIRMGRQNPGSTVRFDLLQIFEAAGRNDRLLKQLSMTVDGWLNQLVQGLQSPFKSVRDETCQVLCFMTSSYPVMRELYLSKYFDVVQDICMAVLRAVEIFEDTFPEYFILLAHMIHYCPSRSIIDVIIERWSNFRCIGLILQWPRLIYYALRYWPDDALCLGGRLFSIRVAKALETALQRPLTAKVCRSALYHLQVRFSYVSHFFTIYYNKESAQCSVVAARGGRHH